MADPALAAPGGYSLPRDTLLVRGPDRTSWLDGLLTCAVSEVAPGAARYGLLLTKQGKIVTDVFLAESGTELLVGVAPGQGAAVHELLDRYLVMEDAELVVPAAPPAWLLWVGPVPAELPVLAAGELRLRELSVSLLVAPAAPPGVLGASRLADLLAQHGLGSFGIDFGERDNPHEASLDRVAVSWTKGCYLGQEVVCMQDMRGKVKRRLVVLAGDAGLLEAPAEAPTVLGSTGEAVGQVTSAHAAPDGACLLASVATAALEGDLSVLGRPVRVVTSPGR